MTIETYELHLPYYKQGDDLSGIVDALAKEGVSSSSAAFEEHAKLMDHAAQILRHMARYAENDKVKIAQADVHFIAVKCEQELGETLVKEGLLDKNPFEEDDDEDEDESLDHEEETSA